MSEGGRAGSGAAPRGRKSLDRALVLPLVGVLLLLPPLAGIFEVDADVFGVPFALAYLFAVWAGLIAGAWRLSRQLRENQNAVDSDSG